MAAGKNNMHTPLEVLYEDNHLLVIVKPVNIPVQEDESKDLDVLSMIKLYLKEKYQKPGNVFVGLVHRLDRPVGGVMVFAKTSKAASRLSEQVRVGGMRKIYRAVLCGQVSKQTGELIDYLVKNTKTNTVSTTKDTKLGKRSRLTYTIRKSTSDFSLVEIELDTGRSHQIRVQFASRNLPLWGDQRYHKQAKPGQQIALWATQLSFQHPVTKELLTFSSNVPAAFPWNQF